MAMVSNFFLIFIILFAALANATNQKTPLVLELATTEWCPYACEGAELGKGIVYDYLSEILADKNIELNVVFLPWSRAIKEVNSGRYHGLLTAIQSEAPNLRFTTTPSMYYQMCFYTESKNDWHYVDTTSLNQVNLAVIKDYGYGEPLDSFITQNQNSEKLTQLSGIDSVSRLIQMLDRQRIDAFIEDKYVVQWQTSDNEVAIKQAGCLKRIPFYMAFSPSYAEETKIITIIDDLLRAPENQTLFHNKYLPRYFPNNLAN